AFEPVAGAFGLAALAALLPGIGQPLPGYLAERFVLGHLLVDRRRPVEVALFECQLGRVLQQRQVLGLQLVTYVLDPLRVEAYEEVPGVDASGAEVILQVTAVSCRDDELAVGVGVVVDA